MEWEIYKGRKVSFHTKKKFRDCQLKFESEVTDEISGMIGQAKRLKSSKGARDHAFKDLLQQLSKRDQELQAKRSEKATIYTRKVEAVLHQPEFEKAQGLILVVGMSGVRGSAIDTDNVSKTFKELGFAVYRVTDPTAEKLDGVVQAAARIEYPINYKFLAFYFAGHGGMRTQEQGGKTPGEVLTQGELFVRTFPAPSTPNDHPMFYTKLNIIEPWANVKLTRLFFLDCCQSPSSQGSEFRDTVLTHESRPLPPVIKGAKPAPKEVVAFAVSKGERATGNDDIGGVWTYHLCKNLRMELPLVTVLAQTNGEVNVLGEYQTPSTTSNVDNKFTLTKVTHSSASYGVEEMDIAGPSSGTPALVNLKDLSTRKRPASPDAADNDDRANNDGEGSKNPKLDSDHSD